MHRGDIGDRKNDHIDLVLSGAGTVAERAGGLSSIRFEHVALPELDMESIDLTTRFLGRDLAAPLLISSMTGGPERAGLINDRLAEAAQHLKIALAVGSQRIALEGRASDGLTADLRRRAPDIPLLANIGAVQLVAGLGADGARRAVDMLEADALILHLNPLQEAIQPGGNHDFRGILGAIETLTPILGVPVIAKEVGAGLSAPVARRLVDAGVAAIDVAGTGGTSFAAIEAQRQADPTMRAAAAAFADWGVPTAQAIADVRAACPGTTLIGSGGVRTGVDVARVLRLGADMAGQAAAGLGPADHSTDAVISHFSAIIWQLRVACFCTGSADIAALAQARLLPPL
ncbi:type 2 isopentenyl-diphosphate Delta-isomerase [Aureimonas altamirensis]|uniref:type 2 isopentenyl-diphosphate Delta-isomerase n=1 Tax=Aureimonas altamirensis TaxID=370622 RepID=UPI001E30F7C8|nr:type 2 isopentenyl-diphosphate Delta-isomerase [Aureimonas altamirensis]UHD47763.1 type 2 isopentenyl-diphosphate Delta-isomerase [Aureimonas altamirensis]